MREHVTWTDIDLACRMIAIWLKKTNEANNRAPLAIIPVMRGGLIPATILSHQLNLPVIMGTATPATPSTAGNFLVVDDITDTGKTFKELKELFPNALYVSLYAKPKGLPYADISFKIVAQDCWLVFPWEQPDEPEGTRGGP
jgi:xanthine phosphoribosyltransferase